MSLIRKENNLRKAQARLDKVSKRSKQLQIRFQREQNKKGRFRTKIHIERGENEHHSGRGILHKAVGLKYRVKGDRPSITRFINSTEPKNVKGKIAKKTAQAVKFAVHDVMQTTVDTGLAAETTAIKLTDTAQREARNKLKQKYTREAVDDYHKGVFLMGRTAVDAVKGTRNHFKQKKQFQLERAKFKLKKADNKLYRAKIKPKLADNKADLRKAKKKYGLKRRPPTTKFRRLKNMRLRQELRQSKRELKFERTQIKTEKKFRKKELSVQKKITKNCKPTLLLLKPAKYTAGRMKASAWQKAVNEDQDNDFVHVIDSAKRRIIEPAVQKISLPERLQREQKKRDSVHNKKLKSDERLKKQDNKLKDKHDSYKQRKRKPKQQNKQAKKTFKETISQAFKYVKNIYEQEVKKFFGTIAVPILIILLVFAFIIMIFTSVISGGGFTLGTYAAQDYDLSEAEKYYTKLAYDMNEKILKVSDSKKWKTGLTSFGANKKDLKDKPDKWYWGKSDVYDWDPEYDFDCYKLWAFLCAYYYDFDAADNGDIKYWKFKSDTKTLLEELFNAEYEFVYWYDNKSRWEELDPYNYWGGGSASEGTYYRLESASSSMISWYFSISESSFSELSAVFSALAAFSGLSAVSEKSSFSMLSSVISSTTALVVSGISTASSAEAVMPTLAVARTIALNTMLKNFVRIVLLRNLYFSACKPLKNFVRDTVIFKSHESVMLTGDKAVHVLDLAAEHRCQLRMFKHSGVGIKPCKLLFVRLNTLSQELLSCCIFGDFFVYAFHCPSLVQHKPWVNIIPTNAIGIYIYMEIYTIRSCFSEFLPLFERVAL